MGTVTGFTAERMQAIEDGTVVSGTVNDDGDLILTHHDGSTTNAGNVIGPAGAPGADGGGGSGGSVPTGVMLAYTGAAAPSGFLLCDGSSYLQTAYEDLFGVIGTNYGSVDGTHFNVPDMRLRVPVGKTVSGTGSTLGGTGGSKDAIVVAHTHTFTTASAGSHAHNTDADSAIRYLAGTVGLVLKSWSDPIGGVSADPMTFSSTATDSQGAHTHTGTTDSDGASGTDANLPPYSVVNWIIAI